MFCDTRMKIFTAVFLLFSFCSFSVIAQGAEIENVELTDWQLKRIDVYLERAEQELSEGNIRAARSHASRADRVRRGNTPAQEMLARIDDLDAAAYVDEEPQKTYSPDGSEAARDAEAPPKTIFKRHLALAEENLEKGDLVQAGYYLSLAEEMAGDSPEIRALDKRLTAARREEQKRDRRERIDRVALTEDDREGILTKFDEPAENWFERFKDLFRPERYAVRKLYPEERYTIDECVEIAKRNSLRLNMAIKRLDLVRMRLTEARRDLMPDVTARYERSHGRIFEQDDPVDWEGEKWQIEVKHNVFDGFAGFYALQQAEINNEIMELERQKVENEIIEETRKAYHMLDRALKAHWLQEELHETFARYYEVAKGAYEKELIPKTEYLKVKGQKLQSDYDLATSRESVRIAEMILLQNMNVDDRESIDIEPVKSPGGDISIGLENLYNLAYTHRPELVIKARTMEYFSLERKINRAKGLPQVEAHGSFGQAYERAKDPSHKHHGRSFGSEWFAGATVRVPFWGNTFLYRFVREEWQPTISAFRGTSTTTSYFNFGLFDDLSYFSDLEEARLRYENAKYEFLKEKEQVTLEVKELYFKYRRSLVLREVAAAKSEHQQTYVDVLEQRLRHGEMEASKLLEEVEKLYSEKFGFIQAESNYFISLDEINKAVGLPGQFKPESAEARGR